MHMLLKNKISAEYFAKKMEELSKCNDVESRHKEMDNLMCECLIGSGCKDGVGIFQITKKWWA